MQLEGAGLLIANTREQPHSCEVIIYTAANQLWHSPEVAREWGGTGRVKVGSFNVDFVPLIKPKIGFKRQRIITELKDSGCFGTKDD